MSARVHYQRLKFRDVEAEEFKEILDRSDIEHTIVGGKRGAAEIEQFHGQAFSLDRGHYAFPVVVRGQFAPGCICIGMVKGVKVPTWINGSATARGDLQFYSEGADILYRAGPEAHWAGLTVTREQLQAEAWKLLGKELQLPDPGGMEHLHIDPEAFDRLAEFIRCLRPTSNGTSLFHDAESSSELVLGAYVEAIATTNPSTANAIRTRVAWRNQVVRRADAFMRSLVGSAYSSARVCKALGMSERNLELYFREALGISPKAWFLHLCLHRARAMLRRSKGHVTDVALACGFEHFGRFAAGYRTLFGECPSETLRSSASSISPKQPTSGRHFRAS